MRKKQLKIAKVMFKNSLTGGNIDAQKVKKVLKNIKSVKILKAYKKLVESKLAKESAIVESAATIKNQKELSREIKAKTGARIVIFRINPKITLGARIVNGDWIWDQTLDAKLSQLITGQ